MRRFVVTLLFGLPLAACLSVGLGMAVVGAQQDPAVYSSPYSKEELALLIPARAALDWQGLTCGLGPDPDVGQTTCQYPQLGITAQAVAYNSQADLLTMEVTQSGPMVYPRDTTGFITSRKVGLSPWEPFTFSNGSCAGYLFWHRQKGGKGERLFGYAFLQIRGFCP